MIEKADLEGYQTQQQCVQILQEMPNSPEGIIEVDDRKDRQIALELVESLIFLSPKETQSCLEVLLC